MEKPDKYDELKAQLKFDPMRIDEELIEFPVLVQEVGELLAGYIAKRDALDHVLDEIKAEQDDRIRRKYATMDGKVTEGTIKAAVITSEPVVEATKDLEAAKYKAARWSALHEAVKQKSYSMARYTELLIAGFIARDSAYQERKEAMNEKRQFRRRETGSRL